MTLRRTLAVGSDDEDVAQIGERLGQRHDSRREDPVVVRYEEERSFQACRLP
jgi:hypothetical protein